MQRRGSGVAVSDSEALTAFGAACIQYGATGAGCHAGAEAMGAFATHNRGLESTFHRGLAKLWEVAIWANPMLDRQQTALLASGCLVTAAYCAEPRIRQ